MSQELDTLTQTVHNLTAKITAHEGEIAAKDAQIAQLTSANDALTAQIADTVTDGPALNALNDELVADTAKIEGIDAPAA